jgi:hypothetical protein
MCCYRFAAGEYRLDARLPSWHFKPLLDQWIPAWMKTRANGEDHTTKWSNEILENGPAVTKDEFVAIMTGLKYKSASWSVSGSTATGRYDCYRTIKFEVLADGKKETDETSNEHD